MAKATTPLMQQYLRIKREHPDEILLFRLGDFYETFFEDARSASKALDIALTSRNAGDGEAAVPLAGFPAHAAEGYIGRLLQAGHRIAVCEQVEDPAQARGLVRREVVEILSTGTALSADYLQRERNNYLLVAAPPVEQGGFWGLAAADVSTGEFVVAEVSEHDLVDEIERYDPSEIILPEDAEEKIIERESRRRACTLTRVDAARFQRAGAQEGLCAHFGVTTLKGIGLEDLDRGVGAAGALIAYLQHNRIASLGHLKRLRVQPAGEGMRLDAATQRNLELVANLRDGTRNGTLLEVLDHTRTPMGARALRHALLNPLTDPEQIQQRLEGVEGLLEESDLRATLTSSLEGMGDLERLAVRMETGKGTPRDLAALRDVLRAIPDVQEALEGFDPALLQQLGSRLDPLPELAQRLQQGLRDEVPLAATEGGLIRPGFHEELDRLQALAADGKGWIARLQHQERERTGIPTLKVGYNKVFGYFLEVTRAHADKIPADYLRKQTLVGAERYITPSLKEKEEQVLGAQEQAYALEYELFCELRRQAAETLEALQQNAEALGILDLLLCFAEGARVLRLVRPRMTTDGLLEIEEGRHPVVEALLPQATFIPNDTHLNPAQRVAIVTGPNMAGKSTYLRQVGLICLMAQAGSFVPAARAHLPVLDRIFTRVGALDNLAGGESTFLVEMHETANILHHATPDSLVLLDEVGRGTSTYDGLSIAWAVAEYLHEEVGAKTIFATHYHELTVLAERLPHVFNLNVAVKEWGDRVIFLHKIVPGGCDHSYGIHVAELAGVPAPVLDRARAILLTLESERPLPGRRPDQPDPAGRQTHLFTDREPPVLERLRTINPEELTPLEALNLLAELHRLL